MRRVRKEEVQFERQNGPDPLDYCLECWKEWMDDDDRDLGAKTMGGLVGDSDGHGTDSIEDQRKRDHEIARATDAMIDSLSKLHVWAIYKSCSVGTPWRFPNADFATVVIEARDALVAKLKKNVCTGSRF